MENNEKNTRTTQENEQEMLWDRCCELFIQAQNGNFEALIELEEISKNGDLICMGYFSRVINNIESFSDQDKINQIGQRIRDIVSNLKSNSSSFDDFIQNLSNKHQQFIYGCLYGGGIGIEKNDVKNFRLIKLSADQGHVLAEYQMGNYYLYQNKVLSFQYFMKAAEKGYSLAQYNVGGCYEYGVGVGQDHSLALEWYKKSAEIGNPESCYKFGWCYFLGMGTEVNEEEALRWFQIAAEKKNSRGLLMTASFYHYGRIVERDRNKSIQLLEKTDALRKYPEVCCHLGLYYLQDQTDPSNQTKGFQILKSVQNSNPVKIALGLCFEFGLGVEKDQKKVFELYAEASIFPLGRYNVGRCYEEGIGVDIHVEIARKLFEATKGEVVDAKNRLREFEEDKIRVRFRNKRNFH